MSALSQLLSPGAIRSLFQPLYHVGSNRAELHGFECLTRGPAGTNFEHANVLFDYVRLKREESAFDRTCVANAVPMMAMLPPAGRIGLNVHASTLGSDEGFVGHLHACLSAAAIPMSRITIEIVEHAPPWDSASFLAALAEIRRLGGRVALDDVGLGQSNFKMIVDVCPEYLKVDRYFAHGCHADPRRLAVIRSIQQLASDFNAEVVAEGVEHLDDLRALMDTGISLIQGYIFSPPVEPQRSATIPVSHALPHLSAS